MRKLTVFFLLLFFSGLAISQNVYSALQLNAEREYKTKRPKKIIETNTFFNKSGNRLTETSRSSTTRECFLRKNGMMRKG
jgi:SNF family Na+-dependent transporter